MECHFCPVNGVSQVTILSRCLVNGVSLSTFESDFIPFSTTEPDQNYIKIKILILRRKKIIIHVALFWGIGMQIKGFPVGSKNKESVCIRGDLGSVPGFGRSSEKQNGNPL